MGGAILLLQPYVSWCSWGGGGGGALALHALMFAVGVGSRAVESKNAQVKGGWQGMAVHGGPHYSTADMPHTILLSRVQPPVSLWPDPPPPPTHASPHFQVCSALPTPPALKNPRPWTRRCCLTQHVLFVVAVLYARSCPMAW